MEMIEGCEDVKHGSFGCVVVVVRGLNAVNGVGKEMFDGDKGRVGSSQFHCGCLILFVSCCKDLNSAKGKLIRLGKSC